MLLGCSPWRGCPGTHTGRILCTGIRRSGSQGQTSTACDIGRSNNCMRAVGRIDRHQYTPPDNSRSARYSSAPLCTHSVLCHESKSQPRSTHHSIQASQRKSSSLSSSHHHFPSRTTCHHNLLPHVNGRFGSQKSNRYLSEFELELQRDQPPLAGCGHRLAKELEIRGRLSSLDRPWTIEVCSVRCPMDFSSEDICEICCWHRSL